MKCSPVPEVPPAVVAFTVTMPAAWAGDVAVTRVVETKVTVWAGTPEPPNVSVVAPVTKFEPVMVTLVPPLVGPTTGVTLVTVGAAS